MRINTNSAFYRQPVDRDTNQRLLLEATRYSVNMCFSAWDQLIKSLILISTEPATFDEQKYYSFLFAWSIVDNLDKLEVIFTKLKVAGHQDLIESMKNIHEMRNTYHHIYARTNTSLSLNFPLFGTLNWAYKGFDTSLTKVFTMVSGEQSRNRKYNISNPVGKKIDVPIGIVTLTSVIQSGNNGSSISQINISEIMERLDSTILKLENFLEKQNKEIFLDKGHPQQDLLFCLDYRERLE